jgi:hypothetical protein
MNFELSSPLVLRHLYSPRCAIRNAASLPPGLFMLLFGIRFLGIFVLPQFQNFVHRHMRYVIASILRRSLSISTLLLTYIRLFTRTASTPSSNFSFHI